MENIQSEGNSVSQSQFDKRNYTNLFSSVFVLQKLITAKE